METGASNVTATLGVPGRMTVKATREGLVGEQTASGYVIDQHVPFVALPAAGALQRFLRVRNPKTNKTCLAIVLDIGPWNGSLDNPALNDDAYVFHGRRPQSESGTDLRGRKTNGAGIDLGERVWKQLGMTDNTLVEWEFLT